MNNSKIISDIQSGINRNAALTLLYENNTGLIGLCVRPYKSRPDYEDIQQEAFIALVNASQEYDEAAGSSFASYAIKRIKWHLIRYTESQTAAHIPQNMIEDMTRYRQLAAGGLNDGQIIYRLGINRARLNEIKKAIASEKSASLYMKYGDDENLTLMDTIRDDRDDMTEIENKIDQDHARRIIEAALKKIPEYPARITRLVYFSDMSIKEISEELGLSYSRAARYKTAALKDLKRVNELRELYNDTYGSRIYKGSYSRYMHTFTSITEYEAIRHIMA